MKVYFVRHAESVFNPEKIHQPAEASLSLCGKKQAQVVGRKFLSLSIDIILSSPNTRAKETAEIISQITGKKNRQLYFLQENRKPSQIIGKKRDSKEAKKIIDLFYKNAQNFHWYFSDEENFFDLVARAKRTIKYISTRKEKNILVITHSNFLKLMICIMMFGQDVNAEVFKSFVKFFSTKNTGITMCKRQEGGKWRLITWNDYTHLKTSKQEHLPDCISDKKQELIIASR